MGEAWSSARGRLHAVTLDSETVLEVVRLLGAEDIARGVAALVATDHSRRCVDCVAYEQPLRGRRFGRSAEPRRQCAPHVAAVSAVVL